MLNRLSFTGMFLLLFAVGQVQAGPITFDPPGLPWYRFEFTGVGVDATGGGAFPPGPPNTKGSPPAPWTFSGAGSLLVTDAFAVGDIFEVFDFGVSVGTTSVPDGSVFGGATDNPLDTFASGAYSSGTFAFGPGAHSITIRPTASPFGSGAAMFQLQAPPPIPEPSSFALLGIACVGAFVAARRRRQDSDEDESTQVA